MNVRRTTVLYRIIDDSGVVCAEITVSEELFPKLMQQLITLTTPEQVARYTPTHVTLLEQMQLLAAQSKENPQLSAANSEAMCIIAKALEDID